MTRLTYEKILAEAAPGSEITPPKRLRITGANIERPKMYWHSGDKYWAIYTVSGSRLGETTIESIKHAAKLGLCPLVIVRDNDEIRAVADRYIDLQCHIACPIAGRGSLIPPISMPTRGGRRARDTTRIPKEVLNELAGQEFFPSPLRRAISRLHTAYCAIPATTPHDSEAERAALIRFMHSMLKQMGFTTDGNDSPLSIHQLERAGWGGSRDHYFHSFQNYFFGLYALCKLEPQFIKYRESARLHWEVDPFHVWFLACLWHDVGYGTANLERIHEELVWGNAEAAEESAESTRLSFLESADAKEGLIRICALIDRLIHPEAANTEWMVPMRMPSRNRNAQNIHRALRESVMHKGHGAPSAIRLYCDFMPSVRRLAEGKQNILTQVILLASASLPFHDDNFRNHLRECHGPFSMSCEVLPFAALLAFIDSIQDDRRDLAGITEELRFLEEILVEMPATITARVNKNALHAKSLLWKAVEARDILAHLVQSTTGLFFKYPDWMVAI